MLRLIFSQKLIKNAPVTIFTLVPYNLNRNINFIRDDFYTQCVSEAQSKSPNGDFFREFVNKKLNHLGLSYYDFQTERYLEHSKYLHFYKNGIIEFGFCCGFVNDYKYVDYSSNVGTLKKFLYFSEKVSEHLKINEFNLNISVLNISDSFLYTSDFSRYRTNVLDLNIPSLSFEYDLTISSLDEKNIKDTLSGFSDELFATFGIDVKSENHEKFKNFFSGQDY